MNNLSSRSWSSSSAQDAVQHHQGLEASGKTRGQIHNEDRTAKRLSNLAWESTQLSMQLQSFCCSTVIYLSVETNWTLTSKSNTFTCSTKNVEENEDSGSNSGRFILHLPRISVRSKPLSPELTLKNTSARNQIEIILLQNTYLMTDLLSSSPDSLPTVELTDCRATEKSGQRETREQ